jgi:F-type H+-transporting ATPase subunit b
VNINVTLLGQMITFSLLVYFTMKKVWPPIMQAMQQRQKRIAEGLAAAERGAHEQERAKERAAQTLREAKQQAAEVITQAQKRSTEIIEEAKRQAKEEGSRQLAVAQAEIEQETVRAREQLRQRVGELALVGASRIIKREIDAKAHSDLIDELAAQV